MDTGSILIVMLALFRVLPVILGPAACRRVGLGAALLALRSQIPDNGAGPVITERRDAVALLEENCRQCGRCWLAGDAARGD